MMKALMLFGHFSKIHKFIAILIGFSTHQTSLNIMFGSFLFDKFISKVEQEPSINLLLFLYLFIELLSIRF